MLQARELDDRVIVAHVRGTLTVPAGPLAGTQHALATVVLAQDGEEHRVAAFHNTLVGTA